MKTDATMRGQHTPASKRASLLQAIRKLESAPELSSNPALASNRRVALAEAEFRLAILPDSGWKESLERLQKAVASDPFHPKFFFHLGRLYHRNGDYGGAVLEYRQALKLAPASHRACVHLALALLELQETEKAIGRDLLGSLARGSEHESANLIAELDALLQEQRSEKKKETKARRRKPSSQKETKSTAQCRWRGVWRLALIDQLCRTKPIARQVDMFLTTGAQGAKSSNSIEYPVVCMLLLLNHDTGQAIRRKVEDGGGLSKLHPAGAQLIEAALSLVESESPGQFVEKSAASLQSGALPVELVCWLFYDLYAGDKPLSIAESLDLLDRYPTEIQSDACFRELRVAVLDVHARRAWTESQVATARLIWREILSIDPYRISAAHNLALAAARAKSVSDYVSDWERATQLRYLHAAAASDSQVMLEDRRTMHLAFAQQSRQRYCATTPAKKEPSPEELAAWLDDREAIEIWLGEWDLYYLNSRLGFRSPVHLLGVPRDASPEVIRFARDVLVDQLSRIGKERSCNGMKTFCHVAEREISNAFERASTHIGRVRDPWYDEERQEADVLLSETIGRATLLLTMIGTLAKHKQAKHIATGCALGRHFLAMPWTTLQPIFEERGMIERGMDVVKYFEDNLIALAASAGEAKSSDPAAFRKNLSALDQCIQVLSCRVELRVVRSQVLLSDDRRAEAYATAVEALPLVSKIKDPKEAKTLTDNLSAMMDHAAMGELPPADREPRSEQDAERTVQAGRPILEKYPRAGGFRAFLAYIMIQLGQKHIEESKKLLTKGLELAVTEEQSTKFNELLKNAGVQSEAAAAIEQIKNLLEGASRTVNGAIQEVNAKATPETVNNAIKAITAAIADAEEAERLAQNAKMEQVRDQARKCANQCRQALDQLKGVKGI